MTIKKIPELIMINNHGKRQLMDVSKDASLKLPHECNILELINYLEEQHKEGRFQQIIIRKYQDRAFIVNLDLATTSTHKL